MVGTLYTDIQVINGHYQVVTPLPTSIDDTTADPTKSYVYAAFVSHRGPTPTTNFNQSPGYRFGTTVAYGAPPPRRDAAAAVPGRRRSRSARPVVKSFTADGQDGVVDLAWTNPSLFDQIQLVRKVGSAPDEPDRRDAAPDVDDGDLVRGPRSDERRHLLLRDLVVTKGGQLSLPAIAIGDAEPAERAVHLHLAARPAATPARAVSTRSARSST